MNFCTYFDSNYLDKGKVCYYTLKQFLPELKLYVICFDEITHKEVSKWTNAVTILPEELEKFWPDLLEAKQNRSDKEYYATTTPILPLYIFDKYKEDLVFYTDADMAFWSNPKELIDVMEEYSLMVSDQEFEPPRSGIRFNVGILGYRNDEKCKEFLKWWGEKCVEWCYWITTEDGRLADQGYLSVLHEDYNKYNSLSCPQKGVNLGPWNLWKHFITEINGKKKVDGFQNLICYHYHEFKMIDNNTYYPTGWKYTENDIKIIYEPYFNLLKKLKYEME